METRKYPLSNAIKELTAGALDVLALRLAGAAVAHTKPDPPLPWTCRNTPLSCQKRTPDF